MYSDFLSYQELLILFPIKLFIISLVDVQLEPVVEEPKTPADDEKEEVQEKEEKSEELSVWQLNRIAVMKDFEREFGDMEVFLNEGRDRDIDRPIRMGKGRSRLDQLEKKKTEKGSKIASITADEFQNQFKKLKRKMVQFWGKEDKVACLKICIQ